MTTQTIKDKIMPIIKRRGLTKVALFGSVARNEAKPKSDVDILIKFKGQKSLLDLVKLEFEFEEKLGKKVDILTYDSIHPLLKDTILKEQKVIYEKRS